MVSCALQDDELAGLGFEEGDLDIDIDDLDQASCLPNCFLRQLLSSSCLAIRICFDP